VSVYIIKLFGREIIFACIPTYVITVPEHQYHRWMEGQTRTDWQTDGRRTYMYCGIALCVASCGKNFGHKLKIIMGGEQTERVIHNLNISAALTPLLE